jgi:hypothetical protein
MTTKKKPVKKTPVKSIKDIKTITKNTSKKGK